MRKTVQMAILVAIATMCALSLSATTLHMSVTGYYAFGSGSGSGTQFVACAGLACPLNPAVGDVSGTELFTIFSDVEFNGSDTTYSYVLTNLSSTPMSLTGLGISSPGAIGAAGSPTGWDFVGSASTWAWLCTPEAASGVCASSAEPGGPAISTYSMTLAGEVLPSLQQVAIGTGTGQTFQIFAPADWVAPGAGAVITPEPASLALLASGLLGGAWFMRRKR